MWNNKARILIYQAISKDFNMGKGAFSFEPTSFSGPCLFFIQYPPFLHRMPKIRNLRGYLVMWLVWLFENWTSIQITVFMDAIPDI